MTVRFSYIVACSTCGRTTKMAYEVALDACVRVQVPKGWDFSGGQVACVRCQRQWEHEAREAEGAHHESH